MFNEPDGCQWGRPPVGIGCACSTTATIRQHPEGEGPLGNTPVPSGFVTGALNPAAAEWVHARLMGFDPERIPLIREAFGRFTHPLTNFLPDSIRVRIGDIEKCARDILPFDGRAFLPPHGWQGHCELKEAGVAPRESTQPVFIRVSE